jgi:hypothetical protein
MEAPRGDLVVGGTNAQHAEIVRIAAETRINRL